MTRHSKVFVPVSALDAAKLDYERIIKVFKAHKKGGYTSYGFAEEKENVYVLSEQELNQIIIEKLKSLELVSIAEDGSFIYSPIK